MPVNPQTVDEVIADMDARDRRIRNIAKSGALAGAILGAAAYVFTEPEDVSAISDFVARVVEVITQDQLTITRSNAQELLELTGIGAAVGGIIGYVGGLISEQVKGLRKSSK